MDSILIKNGLLINEGVREEKDIWIKNGRIHSIGTGLTPVVDQVLDARDKWVLPGCIDDQVHFREPGLTHKADLSTESRAAVAGGITTFMEMPNTKPPTLTQELLEEKYQRAAAVSRANYSFFMGASNDNLEEVLKTNPQNVCGVKVFMGSSTGNMLVDDQDTLEGIFSRVPMLIAVHCEKEEIVRSNLAAYKADYGEDIPVELHPAIRSEEACYASSSQAVALAMAHGSRLHILHISTAKELALFSNSQALGKKRITSEACVHHLWFSDQDYADLGKRIKWNPAVKQASDRAALWKAVAEDRIDIIATDHAPHTQEEKAQPYTKAPSGGPLVQHALPAMLELVRQGVFSLEQVVEKMCHAPAICFQVSERGYLREGYWADITIVDPHKSWTVQPGNILYKCGWSPFEGQQFSHSVHSTLINGQLAYHEGKFDEGIRGQRILFDRE
ncbi:MAG: dihydroorotase [Bacteroidota bacterium]